ncbi:MAG: DUF1259 domain-containing protein [Bdellovibrionales bacterium]
MRDSFSTEATLKQRILLANAAALILISVPTFGFATSNPLDGESISKLTGLKGQMNEKEAVYKVSFPRGDIKATAAGVKLVPALGLTSWAAFMKAGNEVMMMGDTVLTESQVNPVMSVALENGLEVTALHNHFFGDSPKIMFMHIGGHGSLTSVATAVGKVYAKVKETAGHADFPSVDIDPAKTTLIPDKIAEIFGSKGEFKDGVYKITIGRKTKMHGVEAGAAMGVNTWAAFAGSDDKAIVDGDFAMLESELQPVLKKLRAADINIVAIHNHMSEESPRILFLHFWGVGTTINLAKGLKSALAIQKM